MDGYYVALDALHVRYLTFNGHLKYHKLNNLRNLTINNKYRKMPILHRLSANSHTCRYDAVMLVGFMSSLGVTLTLCYNLVLLGFCLTKRGGVQIFGPNL